jgi:hypothetical protein
MSLEYAYQICRGEVKITDGKIIWQALEKVHIDAMINKTGERWSLSKVLRNQGSEIF